MNRWMGLSVVVLALSNVALVTGYQRVSAQLKQAVAAEAEPGVTTIPVKDFSAHPDTIDVGSIGPGCQHGLEPRYLMGLFAFNGAPEVGTVVASLKRQYDIQAAVESGTYQGDTAAFLGNLFSEVHTAELNPDFHAEASRRLASFPNVKVHLGSSEKVLEQVLPALAGKTVFFYLDAHWNDYWPLLDELKVIARTHRDRAVILIDDARYPHDDTITFDRYGDKELSAEYIAEAVKDVYTVHELRYLIPHDPWQTRVKILLTPRQAP